MIELILTTSNMGFFSNPKGLVDASQRFIDTLLVEGLPNTTQVIDLSLNAEAPPRDLGFAVPFEFATPESQAAFFAKYADILPYKRTGFVRQWHITTEIQGAVIIVRLENDVPHAEFVFGPRQVPGHRTTGWPHYQDAIAERGIRGEAWEEAGKLWLRVTGGAGGVRFGAAQ